MMWQQGTLNHLREFQLRLKPSSLFIRIVIQTDRSRIVHFEKLCIHIAVTDHTNTKRLVLDFLKTGLDDVQVVFYAFFILAETDLFLGLWCGLQKFCNFLLLFVQPLLYSLVQLSDHQSSDSHRITACTIIIS